MQWNVLYILYVQTTGLELSKILGGHTKILGEAKGGKK